MLWMLTTLAIFRFIAFPSLLITSISSVILWQSGNPLFLIQAIWTKLITASLILLFIYLFESKHFIFFNNLGISNRAIYLRMIAIDFSFAATAFTIALLI